MFIKNFKPYSTGRQLQKIVKHCAVGRVLRRRLLGRKRGSYKTIIIYAHRSGGPIQPRLIRLPSLGHLPQRHNVVQNPERPPVRRHHKIVAVNHEIANRTDWQIQLQGLPMIAVVERCIESQLGSGEQQPFRLRVFANRSQESRSGNALVHSLPSRSIVAGAINVGCLILNTTAIYGCISFCRIKVRGFY